MRPGQILHLQRLSTEDGPGIRTTVFLKGCPLRCAWCHNPEAISPRPQTQWFADRCLECGTCVSACPNSCLHMNETGLVIDRLRCKGCGVCGRACPSGALEILGTTVTAEELAQELVKDQAYYRASGGGVTLSGGEPTLQPEFAEALLTDLRAAGIHTALDTCGLCPPESLTRLLPLTDLVLFDLKLMDSEAHRRWTGLPNARILENLARVRDHRQQSGRPLEIWIRTPLIPGATMEGEDLIAIGRYLAEHMQGDIARWELCAFNNLCRDQYRRLGIEWTFADTPLLTAAQLDSCLAAARSSGLQTEIIASGAVQMADAPRE